jgi:hypothetical protein
MGLFAQLESTYYGPGCGKYFSLKSKAVLRMNKLGHGSNEGHVYSNRA